MYLCLQPQSTGERAGLPVSEGVKKATFAARNRPFNQKVKTASESPKANEQVVSIT
jgi:hypothetical protein